jgi:hypothetical protein
MRSEFLNAPKQNGVFGAEILLNVRSGRGCLRADDGALLGAAPEGPATNAFVVWVGRPVIVVSEGVDSGDVVVVGSALRDLVGSDDAPVVFSLERVAANGVRAITDRALANFEREIAKAEAYVLVQCGWVEAESIRVELDGQAFEFRVNFELGADGKFGPAIV